MWITMKFAWTSILLVALVHATVTKSTSDDQEDVSESTEQLTLDELEDGANQSELPILPPLILLDFTNGTNSSLSNDEKTKRTVNDKLGYGFQANNFFAGRKVNYYFPSGKSGTTVSIEESISPFLPQTIIERTKPVASKSEAVAESQEKPPRLRNSHTTVRPLFGQRTKLHASSFDFDSLSTTSKPTITSTTPKSLFATSTPSSKYIGFYTQKPLFQPNPSTPGSYTMDKKSLAGRTPSYVTTTFAPPSDTTFNRFVPQKVVSSTLNPIVSEQYYRPVKTLPPISHSFSEEKPIHASAVSNYPKYTIENGVKYEHKIVWKYPDGRVSNDPPTSYINSYSEYDLPPRVSSYAIGADPSSRAKDFSNFDHRSNLHYQGPVQFPKDSEHGFSKQTSFVKPMTQSRSKNYQYFQSTIPKYTVPKLEVESPNPEYLPPPGVSLKSHQFFNSLGQLSTSGLSKYSSEIQKLLTKVLSPPKESYDSDESETYAGSRYANLLNYNPSISQYIKNPASILNAQPTFIQAGNSLIPVIILRVDGAPPVQQKPTPNINLKALLQQYISQYAHSVSDLSRGTNYDFDEEDPVSRYQDPHYDLKKLTDTLKEISQRASSTNTNVADSVTDSYGNILGAELKSLAESRRNSNYRGLYKKPQKVKSVQIVEDPRFGNYKNNN